MTKTRSRFSSAQTRPTVPTPEQAAWQDLEVGMFIHFAPNTWCNIEQDDLSVPLDKINPARLDTDQWVEVAESMGARYIVFVAKHSDGFCWWQTDTTDYSVKNTPWRGGKGDVMRELSESCRRRGMPLGVYLSPADRKHGIGGGGRARTKAEQKAYAGLYRQQLTEVLGRYGELMEVWFDGSLVVDVGDILKKYAPHAMIFQSAYATIRWVGNEDGMAPYPAWNTVSSKRTPAKWGTLTAFDGDPDGDRWLPNEVDTVNVAPHAWFWNTRPGRRLKTVKELMGIYYRSVGHGAVLLLNQTPDTSGLIPKLDAKRAAEFGAEICKRFGTSLAETRGTGNEVELDLGKKRTLDHVISMEDTTKGERVREYVIEGLVDGVWTLICQGAAIGHKKIDCFAPVAARKIRLRALRAVDAPLIRKLAAYRTGATIGLKRPRHESAYRKIGEWTRTTYKQGIAAIEIDLVACCKDATQYEIRVQPREAGQGIRVKNITFRYEGIELRQFIQPTHDAQIYDLNLTGLGQTMVLCLAIEDADHTRSAGDILIRPKPIL